MVTLTVGGNDAFAVVGPGGQIDPGAVPALLQAYAANLGAIIGTLVAEFPDVHIYVGNLYDAKLPIPGEDILVGLMNQTTAAVVAAFCQRGAGRSPRCSRREERFALDRKAWLSARPNSSGRRGVRTA